MQEGTALLDGATAPTLKPQRTIKISHFSFNDHIELALHCLLSFAPNGDFNLGCKKAVQLVQGKATPNGQGLP